nr:peptidylprolyl isomerase [uncultured Parabacteroides sp.]
MKELLISLGVFACVTVNAQVVSDSVVMTVAGKQVPLSEFIFIAEKNGEVDLSDTKSVKNYVELFKNFKLKVAEAESLGIDQTTSFKNELEGYRAQLIDSYLSDKEGEKNAARAVYDRGDNSVELTHILFRLPEKTVSKDTVAVYQEAMQVYERLRKGEEDIETVGKALAEKNKEHIACEYVRCLLPMQSLKVFEDVAYSLPVGVVSKPVRTKLGFHLIKVHSRKSNPGRVHVAHILVSFPKDSAIQDSSEVLAKAQEIYKQVQEGADFSELAKKYSGDMASAKKGGGVPWFGVGEMVQPFEQAAFALEKPGDISGLVETRFGYHIIKLIGKKGRPTFEEEEKVLSRRMGQGERNFELYKAFDDRMKKEYGYVFYPEAYAELQALCDDNFPTDEAFYEKAKDMSKTLMRLDGKDFPQAEFAYYIQRCPFSTKTYAGDFMQEVYDLFVRDIVTTAERKNLMTKHPEIPHLMQEYRDGILLFEVSNREIWSKPSAQQKALEAKWIADLNKKYPVTVNWKLLKKLKK